MRSKIPFILLSLAVVALAVISPVPGGEAAYSSLPMVMLWAAVAVSASIYIIRRRLYRHAAVFTLHAAFIVILTGAAITWLTGSTETVHLRVGEPRQIGGSEVELTAFNIEYYAGTQAPADFISTLTVDGEEARVSMNRTLDVGDCRLFQSAYDPDGLGTVLTVSRDRAGTAVSYAGYALLGMAMLWCMARRRLRNGALMAAMALPLLAGAAPRSLPAEVAGRMGDIFVYRSGRIMPLSTLAHDFTLKVTGSASYEGLTACQVMTGWLFYYDDWKDEPCIKVKGEGMLSLAEFFNPDGSYRYDGAGHAAANEKFALVSEAATGSLWKIFPQVGAGTYAWLSPVDSPAAEVPIDEWHFMRHSLNYLAELAADGRWDDFGAAVDKIAVYQHKKAGAVLPSAGRVWCERAFVRLTAMPWAAILLLMAGVAVFFFFNARVARITVVCGAVWTAILIALGWIAAGSVPLTDGSQTMLCLSLLTLVAGLAAGRRNAHFLPLAAIAGSLALCVALMGHRQPQVTQAVPVLRSPLLSLHVLAVTGAYALLALMAMCGVAWLAGRRSLLGVGRRLLEPAIFLLAAGIFIGAVWANQSWGRYWGWDAKETWALITMLVYSIPLHGSSLRVFRSDRVFAVYIAGAFVTVLVTYFGVNFVIGGLHAYA